MSSEYEFRIFISSTDYDLVDLRAELESWLSDHGYRPVLSSSEGFPDFGDSLTPWESCLRVLESCQLVVVVIGGRYGSAFDWPHFRNLIPTGTSPTHGEFLYARHKKMRVLVFIRDEMIAAHQFFRAAISNANGVEEEARKHLATPPHISFEALKFVAEVKTSLPIPWIRTFKSVADIKRELRKQLLNELVTGFALSHAKGIHLLIERVDAATSEMNGDDRLKVLQAIGITKELLDKYETAKSKLSVQDAQIDQKNRVIAELSQKVDTSENDREKLTKLEYEVASLQAERESLSSKVSRLESERVSEASSTFQVPATVSWDDVFPHTAWTRGYWPTKKCHTCKKELELSQSRQCQTCDMEYCWDCWPTSLLDPYMCPNSTEHGPTGKIFT